MSPSERTWMAPRAQGVRGRRLRPRRGSARSIEKEDDAGRRRERKANSVTTKLLSEVQHAAEKERAPDSGGHSAAGARDAAGADVAGRSRRRPVPAAAAVRADA